jgi:D-alanyl-D-alanine carboxypeptidase/D-alanyl-D-alanine-endopeptidase (penicillin-binding protein 4)
MDLIEPPFDETPEQDEDFVPDAISLNQNLFKLDLTSDSEALHISFAPGLKYVRFTSDMTLNDLPCSSWFRGWTSPTVEQSRHDFKVVLHGSFPKNCAKHPAISVMDRTMYAELLFTKLWNELGGSFSGKAVEGTAAVDLPVLAEHKSRSLNELNIDIVKESDNVLARMLFHSLGSYQVDSATSGKISLLPADGVNTLVRADRVVRDWLRSQNIDDSGLVFEFGSGLSRKEMIKPSQMVALMKVIYKSNWAPEIMTSMPLVGLDGTMKSRLKNHPVTGRARIKTGTLRNVVAIAGFVPDAQGRTCIVVGFINSDNMKNGSGRAALNALIDWTARSGG